MSEDTGERPVHLEINISTGAVTHTAVTDEEWDEMRRAAESEAREQEQERQRNDDLRAQAAAHPDPLVQALAARAGLA